MTLKLLVVEAAVVGWRWLRMSVTSVWAAFSWSRDLAWTMIGLMLAVAGQGVLHRGQRREGDVVLVGGAVGALGGGDADDLEVGAVDLDRVADRALAGEQLADHGRSDDQHAGVRLLLGVGEPGPARPACSCARPGSSGCVPTNDDGE